MYSLINGIEHDEMHRLKKTDEKQYHYHALQFLENVMPIQLLMKKLF
jgi:hypothetical protein